MRRYRSKKSRAGRTAFFGLALVAASLVAVSVLGVRTREPNAQPPEPAAERVSAAPGSIEQRPRYPYSVIPGGVRDAAELKTALAEDAIAARHYAGFSVRNALLEFVRDDQMRYVSYRMDKRIYWTARKVRITRGEYVLTDGVSTVRARCGNRISDTPQQPTAPLEPVEEAMSWLPPAPDDRIPAFTQPMEMPPLLALAAPGMYLPGPAPLASVTTYFTPPVAPVFTVDNRPWLGTPTPEPGTFLLLGCGAAIFAYKWVRMSRQRG